MIANPTCSRIVLARRSHMQRDINEMHYSMLLTKCSEDLKSPNASKTILTNKDLPKYGFEPLYKVLILEMGELLSKYWNILYILEIGFTRKHQ